MEPITTDDLVLINNLSARVYNGNRLLSNATDEENEHFRRVKNKLRVIADFFSNRYSQQYGPFDISVTSGNPIQPGGTRFGRVWSGIFKGAENKQYAAQISFVLNPTEACLDVGFYFGRAQGRNIDNDERLALETNLTNLAISLSDAISNNLEFQTNYNSLFDFGFTAYTSNGMVLPTNWSNEIRTDARNSQIIARIYPNELGVIEITTLDSFVSRVAFIMGAIRNANQPQVQINITPLSPSQRAKEAERFAEIGHKGELFIIEQERQKLAELGIVVNGYPRHVALESTHFGYDILSLDENQNEIYIEVKSTTRAQNDEMSKQFFITNNEVQVLEANRVNYFIYRVYSVENNPTFEILNIDDLERTPNGYIMNY
ncbi:hypothetical protein SDC9_42435 [bioreactor metagenome]|uniref:Protein NO VEIN C-terminal domain-containing protein n=1 Tax=bioreactor metagenome TaxID=1076179 RepID=A0A644VYP3_9ZZZZ